MHGSSIDQSKNFRSQQLFFIGSVQQTPPIRILHQNIQSISNKTGPLEALLHSGNVDVACVTEHWLPQSGSSALCVQGYWMAGVFCRSDRIREESVF